MPASEPAPAGLLPNWRILGKPGFVAVCLAALAGMNATTNFGLQPIVVKFNKLDPLSNFYYIKWNSFSRIAVDDLRSSGRPFLWGGLADDAARHRDSSSAN